METLENVAQELTTIKTLSKLIDTPVNTIRAWLIRGKIPYVKLPSGGIRFQLSVIREWYKSGAVDTCR